MSGAVVSYWPVALGLAALVTCALVCTWLAERKIQIDAADAWEDGIMEGATRVALALHHAPGDERLRAVIQAHRDALAERDAEL